jgi:hypothetical protein
MHDEDEVFVNCVCGHWSQKEAVVYVDWLLVVEGTMMW